MTPDPTPQHDHDHGAAGFCTDHAQAPDERTETVAQVLREHRPCICGCGHCAKCALHLETYDAHVAAAVVAALDDETARLRASADAWWSEYDRELKAHEATKADLAAAREALDRVRALVDESERRLSPFVYRTDLRAALDPEEPR